MTVHELDVAEIIGGGTPSTKKLEYWNGGIAWLTPRELSSFSGRYISQGERNISKFGLPQSSGKLLPKETVLLTTWALVGYLAIARFLLNHKQIMALENLLDALLPPFLQGETRIKYGVAK